MERDALDLYHWNQDDGGVTSVANDGLGVKTPAERASLGGYGKKKVARGGKKPLKKPAVSTDTPDKTFKVSNMNRQNPGYDENVNGR